MNNTSTASMVQGTADNLADVLERVLDKGIIILGDIRVKVLDIELLTLQVRLVISSLDKAREMGLDWWNKSPIRGDRTQQELSGAASGQIEEKTQSEATPVKSEGSSQSRDKDIIIVKE
jgi:hypothetical protein